MLSQRRHCTLHLIRQLSWPSWLARCCCCVVWVPWPDDNKHGRVPFKCRNKRGRGGSKLQLTCWLQLLKPRRKTIGNVLGTWAGTITTITWTTTTTIRSLAWLAFQIHRACLTTLSHYRTRTGISSSVCCEYQVENAQESCALLMEAAQQTNN